MENVLQSRSIQTRSRGYFSRKINKVSHQPILFDNSTIQQISSQKHLGIYLDVELTFKHNINAKIDKANSDIRISRKFSNILLSSALSTIYRSFIRPYRDYGDAIHDQPVIHDSVVRLNQFNKMRLPP